MFSYSTKGFLKLELKNGPCIVTVTDKESKTGPCLVTAGESEIVAFI